MKNLWKMVAGSITLMRRDPMIVMLLFIPWLAGAVLGLGIPALKPLVQSAFDVDITPYYPLVDMLLLMLTPMIAGMLPGFLMLDERDEGVGIYYTVTPLGGAGYYASRLGLPVAYSIVVAPLLMALFSLSSPALWRVLSIALVGGVFASANALLLMAFAGNKVEGLAVAKMVNIVMLPIFIPFFTDSPWGMIGGFFPAYWMGALMTGSVLIIVPGLAISSVWLWVLYRRTVRRTV
jgi:fluoroquinolone transport system permease protein